MTHYIRRYTGLEGDERRSRALDDVRDYLGHARFEELTGMFRRDYPDVPCPAVKFALLVSLAGVQGYPATAWREHIWPAGDSA